MAKRQAGGGPVPRRPKAWQVGAVAVLGLVTPLFVSTPLSAADTHGAVSPVTSVR